MANRAQPSVYLGGPITGQSFKGATSWRDYAITQFAADGILAFNPMRQEEYLEEQQVMPDMPDRYGSVRINPIGVVTRDRYDVRTVELVLMNLATASDTGKVSIGSMIELGWADLAQKPIVVVLPDDNPHNHAMVIGIASYIVEDLDSGIAVAKSVLLP